LNTRHHQLEEAVGTFVDLIGPFIEQVANGKVDVYNEFSLQHELGFFLRGMFSADKVQFERNVSFFFPGRSSFTKKEIDIAVYSKDRKEYKWAIEQKYPRNGQYPSRCTAFAGT
jgi:hypothetical protein